MQEGKQEGQILKVQKQVNELPTHWGSWLWAHNIFSTKVAL